MKADFKDATLLDKNRREAETGMGKKAVDGMMERENSDQVLQWSTRSNSKSALIFGEHTYKMP